MSFAVLTSPRPSVSLFLAMRPALDELFALDAANSLYYRAMCIGRYVLAMYGVTKVIDFFFPHYFGLISRSRFLASEEYEGVIYTYLDSWRKVAKSFVTLAVRSACFEAATHLCYKAMDLQTPLSPLNIPGLALRGMHWLSLRVFFKDPVAVMGEVAKVVSLAPKTAISRALIFDNTFEILLYRYGYGLFQPVLTSITSIARDTANPNGIGSTTTVTSAAFERFRLNTTDIMMSFISTCFVDYIFAFTSYGIIPFLQGKPTAVGLGVRTLSTVSRVAWLVGVNACLMKIVGPANSSVSIFGRNISVVTVSSISGLVAVGLALYVDSLTKSLWMYIHRKLNGRPQNEINDMVVLRAKRDFKLLVGREWSDMSQVELVGIVSFTHQMLMEALPSEAAFQYGAASLATCINILDFVEPCNNALLMRALDNGDLIRPNNEDAHDPVQTLRADSSVFGPEPSMVVDEDPCAVCLKQLKRDIDDIVIGAQCRHAYHTNCLRECLNLNAKCPLCNTVLLKVAEEERYVVPMAENEHGPVVYLRYGFDYNESAKELLLRMLSKYQFMVSWGYGNSILTSYVQSFEISDDPFHSSVSEFLRSVEPYYSARMQQYGQIMPPYTLVMPPLEYAEDGEPKHTLLSNSVWTAITLLSSIWKTQTFWDE